MDYIGQRTLAYGHLKWDGLAALKADMTNVRQYSYTMTRTATHTCRTCRPPRRCRSRFMPAPLTLRTRLTATNQVSCLSSLRRGSEIRRHREYLQRSCEVSLLIGGHRHLDVPTEAS